MKQNKTKRKDFETHALPELEGIYRTALYLMDNETDAQDLVQESFVKAYHSWDKCQFNPNRRVWLFRIMATALRDKYRPSPRPSAGLDTADEIDGYLANSRWVSQRPGDDSGRAPFSGISRDDVKEVIRNLPDDFRLIIVLSLLEGFSYGETAHIAGIDLETVKSRLHQGRRLMQKELFDHAACEGEYEMLADRAGRKRTG